MQSNTRIENPFALNSIFATPASLSRLLAVLSALFGIAGLAGWTHMEANAAAGLLLAGAALLAGADQRHASLSRLAVCLALAVGVLGLASLGEYLFGWRPEILHFFSRDTVAGGEPLGERISPYGSAAFSCIGLALACLPWYRMRIPRVLVWLGAVMAALIGAVSMMGWLLNAAELKSRAFLPPVGFNTAVGFVMLGAGALLRMAPPRTRPGAGWSIETKVLTGFVVSLMLIIVAAGYTYRSSVEFAASAQLVARSQRLRAAISELYATISEVEAAQRNFLITGNSKVLEGLAGLVERVAAQEKMLARLVANNPVQARTLNDLLPLIDQRFEILFRGIAQYQRGGFEAAKTVVRTGEGRETMAEIERISAQMGDVEESLLIGREADLTRRSNITLIAILLTLVVAAGLLTLLYFAIRREMAGRAKAEVDLLSANGFLDSIIENLPNMLFIKDSDLRLVRLNRAGETLLGYSRADLLGKSDFHLFPKDQAEAIRSVDRQVLKSGTAADIPEQPVVTRSKDTRILHTKKIPLVDAHGTAIFILGISEDITARKQDENRIRDLNAELKQRAAEVEASNKELEAFSYSVSHDLRAPLRHIQGYIQMLTESAGAKLDCESGRYLDVISRSSVQMGQLIDDLLEFSRMGRAEMQHASVDLNRLVREVIGNLEIETGSRKIDWVVHALPKIEGDTSMFRQVFANLIGNAVKYTGGRDPARIEIGCTKEGDAPRNAGEGGDYVTLFIRDNGVGFDMRYAKKLFGVFQRLHRPEEFEGTGIGLANVQRIINRHGGRVWADAAPGQGATFYFTAERSLPTPRPSEG